MTSGVKQKVNDCLNQITLRDQWNEQFFKRVLIELFVRVGIELLKQGIKPDYLLTDIYANSEAVEKNITKSVVNKIER